MHLYVLSVAIAFLMNTKCFDSKTLKHDKQYNYYTADGLFLLPLLLFSGLLICRVYPLGVACLKKVTKESEWIWDHVVCLCENQHPECTLYGILICDITHSKTANILDDVLQESANIEKEMGSALHPKATLTSEFIWLEAEAGLNQR